MPLVVRYMAHSLPLALPLLVLAGAVLAEPSGRWSAGAPMPSSRTEVAVATVADKIYVVGGFGGDPVIEIYDPVTDSWSRGAPLPQSLHHAAAVELGGKLYVVGGYTGNWNPVDSVDEYDPELDRWQARAPLPTARGALAAVVLDGRIHALGGGRCAAPEHARPRGLRPG